MSWTELKAGVTVLRMSQYHTYPSTKGQTKKLITSDWPQQQTIPQEHSVLALNPKSHAALGLGVPVWNWNNSGDNLEEYNWIKPESDYCSKKSQISHLSHQEQVFTSMKK